MLKFFNFSITRCLNLACLSCPISYHLSTKTFHLCHTEPPRGQEILFSYFHICFRYCVLCWECLLSHILPFYSPCTKYSVNLFWCLPTYPRISHFLFHNCSPLLVETNILVKYNSSFMSIYPLWTTKYLDSVTMSFYYLCC